MVPRGEEKRGCSIGYISAISRLYLRFRAARRNDLGYISAASRLHLGYTSAIPRLCLGYASAMPRLYLGYASAMAFSRA